MIVSDEKFCWTQLDEQAISRSDQHSFHICAEGMLSDFRAQIYNLRAGESFVVPSAPWPSHLSIIVCISGVVDVALPDRKLELQQLTQLIVLLGVICTLTARRDSAIEVMSFLTAPPQSNIASNRA
jgi:hypothetical protein